MEKYQAHQTTWQGIPLTVCYCADYSPSYREVYGRPLARLSVTAKQALPISETGFQSRHLWPELVEAEGGPVGFVLAWLDFAAALPVWKVRQRDARQLSFF